MNCGKRKKASGILPASESDQCQEGRAGEGAPNSQAPPIPAPSPPTRRVDFQTVAQNNAPRSTEASWPERGASWSTASLHPKLIPAISNESRDLKRVQQVMLTEVCREFHHNSGRNMANSRLEQARPPIQRHCLELIRSNNDESEGLHAVARASSVTDYNSGSRVGCALATEHSRAVSQSRAIGTGGAAACLAAASHARRCPAVVHREQHGLADQASRHRPDRRFQRYPADGGARDSASALQLRAECHDSR